MKIGSLHRPTACPGQKTLAHGPPGPENGSPWPGPQKKWPENNVFMQSYLIYMSIFKKYLYQFLRGLEGSHRLTIQKVSGSKPGWGRKNLFLFFQFFLDLAKISTKPKVDFRDTAGFFDGKNKFCL